MTSRVAPELGDLLERLRDGVDAAPSQLELLSDLASDEVPPVAAAWPAIAAEIREALMARAVALADERVEFDFTRLALVALDDEEPAVRRLALEALRESTTRPVARRLARVVAEDDDETAVEAAIDLLGAFVLARELGHFSGEEGDRIVEQLRSVAADPLRASHVRATAIGAVAALTEEWVPGLVIDAYYSDDPVLQLGAVHAMGVSASEEWLDFLPEQLVAADPALRVEAAVACGEIASEESVPYLVEALADEELEVVQAAIRALGEIGGEPATEALLEFALEAPEHLAPLLAEAVAESRLALNEPGEESD